MKGQITGMQELITLLVTVGLVSVVAVIPKGQLTKLSPELDAKEFENKALLLANSLLGDSNLIYSNNRAMFDEQKLNTKMIEKSSSFSGILQCPPSSICIKTYPESFSLLLIKDVESIPQKGWFTLARPPRTSEIDAKINSCFSTFDKNKIEQLFDERGDIPNILGLEKCVFQRYTSILTNFKVDSRIISNSFPVSIRDSNGDVHAGWIKVMVVE